MARLPIELTKEQKGQVEGLAAVLTQAQLADFLGISVDTFTRMCDRDPEIMRKYKRGKAAAINSVANGLLAQAREGNLTAQMFYLKTQAGWREKDRDDTPHEGITEDPLLTEYRNRRNPDASAKKVLPQ